MVRYPDTLTVTWKTEGEYDDTTGDFTPGDVETYDIEGRAEANGQGQLIGLTDGSQVLYAWQFRCQLQEFEAPFGAEAVLSNGWSGTVKRQVNNQTHTLIWL
jgi:hypothetical protein